MIRGLYTAGAGMMVQQVRHDVISNNLANVNTTGFKRDVTTARTFPELLMHRVHDFSKPEPGQITKNPPIGTLGTGSQVDGVWTRFGMSGVRETGSNTNLAIEGNAFFAIETPQGMAYTRAGSFHLRPDGTLTTSEGYPVQGQNGNIQLQNQDFKVSPQGDIQVNGQTVDRINLWAVAPGNDPNLILQKRGANAFTLRPEAQENQEAMVDVATLAPAEQPIIRQGFLENANVNVVQEMVEMITASRAYEANQKSIQTQDGTLDKAVNELGRR